VASSSKGFLTMTTGNNHYAPYRGAQAAVAVRTLAPTSLLPPATAPSPPGIEAPDPAIVRLVGNMLVRYGAILGFVVVWELVARLSLVDASVIPPFTQVVAATIAGFADGSLLGNLLVSLQRSGIAFGMAVGLAIPLGLFMGSFRRFEALVDPLLQLFRQTSALAIYPIFILLLGLGEVSKVAIIFWAAFFPILLNTISGVKLVDRRLIEMARVFGASRSQVFKRVVLPGATPAIFVGLRLSATTALLLLVAAEMIGARQGLGFLIINAQYNFQIPLMFAAIVVLAAIGLLVNYALVSAQGWFCRWEKPDGRTHRRPLLAALFLSAALSLLVLPIAAKAETAAPSSTPTVIRYLNGHGQVAPYELAAALGWLQEKGIRIESQGYSQGGPESLVAMASGSVDIAGAATPAVINAISGGAQIVGVMPDGGIDQAINSKFYVLADSPIRSAADLKDKSIAVNTLGAHLDYVMREYLRGHALAPHDVQLIAIPGPQLDLALRHKQADVIAVGAWQSTFGGKIESEGGVRVLFTDYDVLGSIVLGIDTMKKTFVEQHQQAVRDFVAVTARAVDWAAAHPGDAQKLIADILSKRGDNPELAKYWGGYGLRRHALFTEHDIQFWLDVLVREGRLKPGQFTPEGIGTNKYNALAQVAQQ
jgi:ABC-type nitrate/sulfonate/bicarbonate transport system permease component/ABC-type nitrate/sulfonate/bicarbonate transport system substrate-binding protein